jgi:hypothetical protein
MLQVNQLIGFGAGLQNGPFGVTYGGLFQSVGTVTSITTSSFSIGAEYADRIVLVAFLSDGGGDAPNAVTIGGVSASLMQSQTGGNSWWKAVGVPGESIIVSATVSAAGYLVYAFAVSGALGGADSSIEILSSYVGNSNEATVTFAASVIGDIFLAVGKKHNTGSSDNFSNFDGTSGVTGVRTNDRLGTSGDGFGGYGVSPELGTTGSKTVRATSSDSSKNTSVNALRISKRT